MAASIFQRNYAKASISIIVRCHSCDRTLTDVFSLLRLFAIAKHRYFLAPAPVQFETKNNLKGEHLRYDCYYYYRTRSFKL
ncbi:hypothetical protein QUB63_21735 [Microcoleus sp. ARI1-B5]|uniref:hypothetical protein n=1 Tax=unclassified Microcoleus TaxID=2642155 RepID=UPI002FD190B0